MKICPKCQTKYTDLTLQFCLQDGTLLVGGTSKSDAHPTVSFDGETETVISSKHPTEQITQIRNNSAERNWNDNEVTRVSNSATEPKSSNPLIAVLLTVLIMLILFGIIGIGTYLYFNQDETEVAKNSSDENNNVAENDSTIDLSSPVNTNTKTPTKQKTPNTKTNQNTETNQISTPEVDPEETKQAVSSTVNNWKSQAEALNLDGYMNYYASQVDYYKKNGASKSFVRSDKQKAFSKFSSVNVQLSNMTVNPSSDGKSATVVFDKEWNFSNAESSSTGKVQQQLKLIKSGENWLISSEKDLKVYYVNK